MKRLVAFTGQKRCGKTTLTNHLMLKCGATPINFKDALVDEIKNNFPKLLAECVIIYEIYSDQLFKDKPPLIRALLQEYGTEVRRGDNDSYWIDKWERQIRMQPESSIITTDDCRFLNEAKAVKRNGGIIIRVDRPNLHNIDHHISETEMLKIRPDYVIVNDSTIDNLCLSLDALLENI